VGNVVLGFDWHPATLFLCFVRFKFHVTFFFFLLNAKYYFQKDAIHKKTKGSTSVSFFVVIIIFLVQWIFKKICLSMLSMENSMLMSQRY
jgi:hypothetical protein